MSGDQLARLRADLEVIERYAERQPALHHECDRITREIARLEAAAADPWREAKAYFDSFRNHQCLREDFKKAIEHYDHLTAENDRLAARVAELEDAKYFRLDPETGMLEVDHVGPEPILDPARVLTTAFSILGEHVSWTAKPYRLKGGDDD